MLFPTLEFALFFIIVYCFNWWCSNLRFRKWILIGASYFFYGFWDIRFTILLFISSVANWLIGRLLAYNKDQSDRKKILAIGLTINLGALGFFKYTTFLIGILVSIFVKQEVNSAPILDIILPIGISFFTFQGISYIVDIYRNEVDGNHSLTDVILYISFFPQLVAGPIIKAQDFLPQLRDNPDSNKIQSSTAFLLIVGGLFKKLFIAQYLATKLVQPMFDSPLSYGTTDAVVAIYAYAVQIYCDFSAYSDIAIGVALLLGFHFPMNFKQPYQAKSLQDFWRRWHISLSSWLRDYLYKSLGGNRRGKSRTYVNLLITMLLGGLWHGAAWRFIAWGFLHGAYLALERFIREKRGEITGGPFKKAINTIVVFNFVCFCWIFFAASDINNAFLYLEALTQWDVGIRLVTPFSLSLVSLGVGMHFVPLDWYQILQEKFDNVPLPLQGVVMGGALLVITAIGPRGISPFIYFQF